MSDLLEVGWARTVYVHRTCTPYIWWFPCYKRGIMFTVYTLGWPLQMSYNVHRIYEGLATTNVV